MNKFLDTDLFWIRKPFKVEISNEQVEIYTEPGTDL